MKIHIVQKGDTLYDIAKNYGVHFEEIVKVNPQLSSPDMIMPGMKIKIPSESKQVRSKQDKAMRVEPKEQQARTTERPMEKMEIDDHVKPKDIQVKVPSDYKDVPTEMPPIQTPMVDKNVMNEKSHDLYGEVKEKMDAHTYHRPVTESSHDSGMPMKQPEMGHYCCRCMQPMQPMYNQGRHCPPSPWHNRNAYFTRNPMNHMTNYHMPHQMNYQMQQMPHMQMPHMQMQHNTHQAPGQQMTQTIGRQMNYPVHEQPDKQMNAWKQEYQMNDVNKYGNYLNQS